MLFSTGNNVIDIDAVMTKELYRNSLYVWQRCHCPVCRNFDEIVQGMNSDNLRFFSELGIEADKCCDLWPYEPGKREGTQKYLLSYPVICRPVRYGKDEIEWYKLDDDLSVAIVYENNRWFIKLDWELVWTHR